MISEVDMADAYSTINDILVRIFNDIMTIEQKKVITGEFTDITVNDMHIINAIGIKTPKNMSSIAKELSVTVGTLTIAMNSLVKKGYVIKKRSDSDRRVVYIHLSDKGIAAFHHHENFHKNMIDSVIGVFDDKDEEMEILIRALSKLVDFITDIT